MAWAVTLLPLPLSPTMARTSPGSSVKLDVAHGADLADGGVEDDGEVVDCEERFHQRRSFGSVASRRPSPISCSDSMVRLMASEGKISM